MTEGTPQPLPPLAATQGNFFLNGTMGAGSKQILTGYEEREFTYRPKGTVDYQTSSNLYPQYSSVDAILQGLARLDATDPEAYKEYVDLLKDTRFTSWSDFFDSAIYSDMPWEEYLTYRAQTDKDLYGEGGSGGPFRSTQSTTTLSSESDAARIVDEVYRNYLGRTASDEEVTAFQEVLNAAQRANPSTATTTGYRGSSNSSSNTVQTTGFDPARFAREYAQSQEGYAERLAGITFMDAIDNVIRSAAGSLDEFVETIQ